MTTSPAEPHGRLLELVHASGPHSRSDLAERIGVNRSTIAAHVAALSGAGLVVERTSDPGGRVGRPSPIVGPDPRAAVVAVVPEVDALTVAIIGMGAEVREQRRFAPALTADAVAESVAAALREWSAEERWLLLGLGVAVPGLVDHGGRVARAPRLGWRDLDLREPLERSTGLLTAVGNDASLGARAEHLFGAGAGVDEIVYLNGGASGIGGGVIAEGRLLRGAGGFAGEFGHNVGAGGELEAAVGRDALLDVLGLAVDAAEHELAAAMASTSDPRAARTMSDQRAVLAGSIANAVNVLNPSLVILGGFLAAYADGAMVDLVRAAALPEAGAPLRVMPASLGADRLLIGAAELALEPVLRAPLATVARRAAASRRVRARG